MTENIKHDNEPRRQIYALPISCGVADKSLESIIKNPAVEYRNTIKSIKLENPEIYRLITSFADTTMVDYKLIPDNLIFGYVLGYRLIKDSAQEKGIKVPVLKSDDLLAYFDIKSSETKGILPKNYIEKRRELISQKDPNFMEAIDKLSNHMPPTDEPDMFFFGAMDVYLAINQVIEDTKINSIIFGSNTDLPEG
jgi:hypothetical protein